MKSQSERFIRSVLRRLAKQRVAILLQHPGGGGDEPTRVVENAVDTDDEDTAAALRTCHMRGWVEVLDNAIPSGRLDAQDRPPPGWFTKVETTYRLTSAGWDVIRGTHVWVIATFIAALSAVVVGLIGLLLQYWAIIAR